MRLTRQTDYSLRILMFCAASGDRISRVADIAQAYSVSETFIFKLLKRLVDANIVSTTRGRSGGIRLARPADEITVGQVVRVAEDNMAIADCFDSEEQDCPLVASCRLKVAFEQALGAFLDVLDDVTIDDLSKPSAAVINLLAQIDGPVAR
ncbi:MAG: Rrf2 family transcriptional regulator [Pseudomonadota bacterium]